MALNLSPIQNHILSKLKNAKCLRYSELQPGKAGKSKGLSSLGNGSNPPTKIPNDLFNYHLQHLVKKEFITKTGDGYTLAQKGIKHVADPYPTNDAITSLFKINVITIVSRVVGGKKTKSGKVTGGKIEILSQLRKSNPSYGKIGVMGGVVLKGELIEPAATRKLKQETGLDASFKLVGCERRIMYQGGQLFSDLMFPIAYSDSSSGELIVDSAFGHNMWVPIDQAIKNDSQEFDSIKGIVTVLKAIKAGEINKLPFFFEEQIQSQ